MNARLNVIDDLPESARPGKAGGGDESWVSPYLRRPLRSLDEVLAARQDVRAEGAADAERRLKAQVVRLGRSGMRVFRVA